MPVRQSDTDFCEDTFEFCQNLIVPESQNTKIEALQRVRPALVISLLLVMLRTIKFDYEPTLTADEIDNVAGDFVLSSEFEAKLVCA